MGRVIAAIALCAGLGLAAEAAGQDIHVSQDKIFVFAGLGTWNWHPGGAGEVKMALTPDDDPESVRKRFEPLIMQSVSQELASSRLLPGHHWNARPARPLLPARQHEHVGADGRPVHSRGQRSGASRPSPDPRRAFVSSNRARWSLTCSRRPRMPSSGAALRKRRSCDRKPMRSEMSGFVEPFVTCSRSFPKRNS